MTDPVLIRRARRDESAPLSDLAFRSKASWGYNDKFLADCREELTITETDIRTDQFFVLESNGEIIGFCALKDCGAGEGELIDVFVEPARLREGHGRRLVEHAKDAARTLGLRSLRVEADPNAREFYASCGGAQIGTVPSGSIRGRRLPLMKILL